MRIARFICSKLILSVFVLFLFVISSQAFADEPTLESLTTHRMVFKNIGADHGVDLFATFSDGSTQNVVNEAEWTSSDPNVAVFKPGGWIVSTGYGKTIVTGTYKGITTSIAVSVEKPEDLVLESLTTNRTSMVFKNIGGDYGVDLFATFKDGSIQNVVNEAEWTSSNPDVAVFKPGYWIVSTGYGTATLTGTYKGMSVSIDVTVEKPEEPVLKSLTTNRTSLVVNYIGGDYGVDLFAAFSDGSTQNVVNEAEWTSSNPEVAVFKPGGWIISTGYGTATVTGTYKGMTVSIDVTVEEP